MSVSYIEYKGKKPLQNHIRTACYSKISGAAIDAGADRIICYEPELTLPVEIVKKWVATLNGFGFYCSYMPKGTKEYTCPGTEVKNAAYHLFFLDLTKYKYKDAVFSALTLLRYVYEGDFHNYVTKYYDVREKHPKMKPFYAFQVASNYFGGSGHTHNNGARKLVSFKDLHKALSLKGDIYSKQRTNIHGEWGVNGLLRGNKNTNNLSYIQMFNKMKHEKLNVYVVGGANQYANWLPDAKIVDKLADADLVLFTGGEDVDPSLYNEPKNKRTGSNLDRDIREREIYKEATRLGVPKLGICRGSQFLCVMAGGKLVQHQENPEHIHPVTLRDGSNIRITSTHHQAAYPYNLPEYKYEIIGWTKGISKMHLDGNDAELAPKKECEIVYYGYERSLGIQGHPEFAEYQRDPANAESMKTLRNIVNLFLQNSLYNFQ